MDNKSFTKKELELIILRFVIPFLSIQNTKADSALKYSDLGTAVGKNLIEYDVEKKEMNFYPNDICSEFKISIHCEYNKKIKIVRDVLKYILTNMEKYDHRFIESYFDFLIEEGFVNWLALRKDNLTGTLSTIITALKKWTTQTFEGKKKSFVIGVNLLDNTSDGQIIGDIIGNAYFATITEAYNSAIIVNKEGIIIDYVSDCIPNNVDNGVDYILPTKCASLIKQLHKNGCDIILSLEESGDLLIHKIDYKKSERKKRNNPKMKTVIALRNGQWTNCDPINFHNAIHGKVKEKNIYDLFSAILDVSLEHSGGSIAILDDEKELEELRIILSDIDNLQRKHELGEKTTAKDQKRILLEKLLIEKGKITNFFEMDKYKRLELLSMDGATIINKKGEFIAIGAIINGVEPSEDGGARTASVKKLSQYGIAVKISMDGGVTIYKNNELKFKM